MDTSIAALCVSVSQNGVCVVGCSVLTCNVPRQWRAPDPAGRLGVLGVL